MTAETAKTVKTATVASFGKEKTMTMTKIPSRSLLAHMVMVLWKFVSGKEKTMTTTKISSKKTCYTYGHGPLINLLHHCSVLCRPSKRRARCSPKPPKPSWRLPPLNSTPFSEILTLPNVSFKASWVSLKAFSILNVCFLVTTALASFPRLFWCFAELFRQLFLNKNRKPGLRCCL